MENDQERERFGIEKDREDGQWIILMESARKKVTRAKMTCWFAKEVVSGVDFLPTSEARDGNGEIHFKQDDHQVNRCREEAAIVTSSIELSTFQIDVDVESLVRFYDDMRGGVDAQRSLGGAQLSEDDNSRMGVECIRVSVQIIVDCDVVAQRFNICEDTLLVMSDSDIGISRGHEGLWRVSGVYEKGGLSYLEWGCDLSQYMRHNRGGSASSGQLTFMRGVYTGIESMLDTGEEGVCTIGGGASEKRWELSCLFRSGSGRCEQYHAYATGYTSRGEEEAKEGKERVRA
ncbi:hypothetical protein Tco_0651552 [Tanacetum coccineum]|uniref:Uncharacterized protein n=1 Tax=Tanacetum coccineum TaxID=301880 RepID=A0ABQ4WVF6_9ASTR